MLEHCQSNKGISTRSRISQSITTPLQAHFAVASVILSVIFIPRHLILLFFGQWRLKLHKSQLSENKGTDRSIVSFCGNSIVFRTQTSVLGCTGLLPCQILLKSDCRWCKRHTCELECWTQQIHRSDCIQGCWCVQSCRSNPNVTRLHFKVISGNV